MNPGLYDQRITVQSSTQVKGAAGGFTKSWATVCTPWASRTDMPGGEQVATKQGGGVLAVSKVEFRMYYRPGIVASMRVLHGGQIFDIQHVNDPKQKHAELVLTCQTGANDG